MGHDRTLAIVRHGRISAKGGGTCLSCLRHSAAVSACSGSKRDGQASRDQQYPDSISVNLIGLFSIYLPITDCDEVPII